MNDYMDLVDEDDRQKALVREALRSKKKKLKARDIAKAIIRQEKSSIQHQNTTQSDAANQVSNSDTDMDIPKQSKGPVRSLSIQKDNSTKVSSMSDTNNSDDNGGKKQRQQQLRSLRSAVITSNTNLQKEPAAAIETKTKGQYEQRGRPNCQAKYKTCLVIKMVHDGASAHHESS